MKFILQLQPPCMIPFSVAWMPLLLEAENKKIGLDKLDGPTRAKVLAALAGLVILWFSVVALIWLGARITRRYMKSDIDDLRRGRKTELDQDDWASRPMASPQEDRLDDASDEAARE